MRGALICQGAEARVYEGTWLDRDVIIKYRFPKRYRLPELDDYITKERIKAEAKLLTRCRMAGIRTPCLYVVDLDNREIVMEKIKNSDTVRNLIYNYAKDGKCPKCSEDGVAVLSSELQCLAVKIGEVLGKLHKNNLIHGDLTTSNMLLVAPYEESDIVLIDFGLGSIGDKAEDKAVDLYVLERAILSTHPNTELFVEEILKYYEKSAGKSAKAIINKLNEVRMRGRKKLCFG